MPIKLHKVIYFGWKFATWFVKSNEWKINKQLNNVC